MSVVITREEVCVCVSEKQDFNLPGDAFRSKDREITMLVRWYQLVPVPMYTDTEALHSRKFEK